jgi:hypothetical protein
MAKIRYKLRRVGSGIRCTASTSCACGLRISEAVIDLDQDWAETEATRILNIRIKEHECKKY